MKRKRDLDEAKSFLKMWMDSWEIFFQVGGASSD